MFILDLSINRNIGQPSEPPVQNASKKSGEEAFHQMASSKGYNKADLQEETNKRTLISRTRRTDIASRTKHKQLFDINEENGLDEAPVFVNLFVDGEPWTLRHICYA